MFQRGLNALTGALQWEGEFTEKKVHEVLLYVGFKVMENADGSCIILPK